MTRFLIILICFGLSASLVFAQQTAIPNKPTLTVSLEPRHVRDGVGYVQGQIVLRVQLVSPHPFDALQLDLPTIAEARILTLSPPQTREIHNYGLEGYLYETRLALFPEQSGVLSIPPISVTGAVAVGSGRKASFAEVNPEMVVTIKPIDPAYDAPWWLVADAVTMTEVWTPPPEELRVGDIVRRDLTATVYGVTAEHLPAIEQPIDSGYSVVGSETKIKTDLTPDGVIATVRQFWDLKVESEEVISISPIQLAFWDPAAGAMASASLPAKRIEPLPRDPAARRAKLMNDAIAAHRNRRIGLFAALSIPALGLLVLMGAMLYKALPTRGDRHLSQACTTSATPAACFRAVTQWSQDSFDTGDRDLIRHLQQTFGGEAAERLHALQLALFSASDVPAEPKRLARSLIAAARRQRLHRFIRDCFASLAKIVYPAQDRVEIRTRY
ncbi:MAG: hypothetical protein ETSY1_17465 [Candidatus Entotheonella factor]|uniref:Protein BatD n=1 Tax=Entotheonella factor TaxID=1429438 RepID=W4LN28_ENTF1|nr:MAG: hypothetical protein ETSY1_17465 [Candidatus Entotheonella factor]